MMLDMASLSDTLLLERLETLVGSSRRVTAELVLHLAEVEDRRLHLKAGFGSLFSYCVDRCAMSEDEACRRIEAARLGRRFPALFAKLASGELTLSVVSLLKPILREWNQEELLQAVSGKSVRAAREVLAARFPVPDLPSSVRKLPEVRVPESQAAVAKTPAEIRLEGAAEPELVVGPAVPLAHLSSAAEPTPRPHPPRFTSPAVAHATRIDPSAAGRYRVQFTAGIALKEKLELTRDLMRHRNPSGDLAPILESALDLLLDKLQKERFAKTDKPRQSRSARPDRITNSTRRQVAERDGMRCSFADPHGRRCESRAFLEYDHREPRGRGGSAQAENLRLYCRAHNRLAAELAYGRDVIESAIAMQREKRAACPTATHP